MEYTRNEIYLANKHLPGFNPLAFGRQKCMPHHYYGPGSRTYWLIHYVVSGTGIFKKGNNTYHPKAGQCFIVRPDEVIFYQADEHDPWEYIWIGFRTDIKMPDILMTSDIINFAGGGHTFTSILDALKMKQGQTEFLSGKVWEIIAHTMALENKEINLVNDYVGRAKTCIKTEYQSGITISEIARRLGLERSYFSTIFTRGAGVPPQKYLNDYRLEKAAELLVTTNRTISEIAYSTGYSDIVNFSRMFKKHFGQSPSVYREQKIKPAT